MKIYVVKEHYSGGTQNIVVTTSLTLAYDEYRESDSRSIEVWEGGRLVETIGE